MNTSRFLDGPEFAVMHDHGNEENFFDRIDFKPSQTDTFNVNLGFTRSWFQTPNSYDAQNATAWSGLVVDNGGIGPNGQVVGSQDQRSKIRTFNFAPTWTHVAGAHTIFTFGGFVRQDQFNYYPSRDPFADLTPDLQLQTVGQNRTLTNLGTARQRLLRQGHSQLEDRGQLYGHDPHREGRHRDRRSDRQRSVSECRRKPRHGPVADRSRPDAPGCSSRIPTSFPCSAATI